MYWKMLLYYPRRKKEEKVRKMLNRLSHEQRSKVANLIKRHSQDMLRMIAERLSAVEVRHSLVQQVMVWPSAKLTFECQNFAKNLTFKNKIAKNFHFFWKKWKFLAIFFEKCQVFGNFLTVKWQFSGGSADDLDPTGFKRDLTCVFP